MPDIFSGVMKYFRVLNVAVYKLSSILIYFQVSEVALYVQCTYGGISISVSNMFDGFVGALEVAFKGFDMRSFHKMKFALSYKGEVTRYKVLLKLQTDPSYFIVWVCTHLLLRQHTRQTMNG